MKKWVLLIAMLFIGSTASAQFYQTQYRPPSLNWQQLNTTHFKIVFPAGEDSVAWRTGRILENHYGRVQDLTGGRLSNFPVIHNNYNDRSNGFVSSFHFRSEIEIPPIKGKALNPRSGSWLQSVEPHELVHAMQFNNVGGFGIGGLINLFSPDMARSLHGTIPSGILEGLAVQHETEEITPGGGRGNYPFFYNQFNTVFESGDRWSMGQMVQVPTETRPFDRHYLGGYEFTSWLQETYGPGTTREALDYYQKFPLLGYGFALKYATGSWPGQLYNEFEASKEKELEGDAAHKTKYDPLDTPYKGAQIRRPKWLSDTELVFYGSFYNARQGFFRYDLIRKRVSRLASTSSVEDYSYSLSDDKRTLAYCFYRSSPFYDNTFKAELVKLDLESGRSERVTTGGRVYSPVFHEDGFLALQTDHASSRLVKVNRKKDDASISSILSLGENQIIEIAVNPENKDQWAIVVNKQGMQGLWIVSPDGIRKQLEGPPAIAFSGGSVFDPEWHPDGQRLLFSADIGGAMNVYEYEVADTSVKQVTNSRYNAMEASYSPDGSRIAFIIQKGNERLPALLEREDFFNDSIAKGRWTPSKSERKNMQNPEPRAGTVRDAGEGEWTTRSYASGLSWLKPRAVFPVIEEISNSDTYQAGAALHSNNLLRNQSYSLEVTGFDDRIWYDLSYRNSSFFPGFKASVFSEPALRTLGFPTENDTLVISTVRQERSAALSIPVNVVLDRNVHFSSFTIEPEIRRSQFRYFNRDEGSGDNVTDFADLTIGNVFTSLNYRVQQNIRDVQPNSGLVLFSELEHYFSADAVTFNLGRRQLSRNFVQPTALRGGLFAYLSPLRQWNQSLRLGVRALTQTDPVFDNQGLVSDGFSESVFPISNNLISLSARYTVPLFYPDNGGFLLPFYLSNVYLVGFANSVADPTSSDLISESRTVYGGGIRARFRLSNLSFNIGIAIGFEPTRNKREVFIGNF